MAGSTYTSVSAETITHIKSLYHIYRHTADLDRKGLFFSQSCMQICRPTPSYAATTRGEIVQYLKDAQRGVVPVHNFSTASVDTSDPLVEDVGSEVSNATEKGRSVYTIRPLRASEHEFSTNAVTAPTGLTPDELESKAMKEGWVGMRVDLWDEGGAGEGILVKVQYWWRKEHVENGEEAEGDVDGYCWRHCLHDIMYLGPKDGTEGVENLEVLE
ncbi:hypothetical protein P153DRAFT_366743 [Dothidotthia symphoricarpi CBS 119687]|uniref:SnoaL-like domain-containing protein n=1 Tax=Dothidotthia symphoricarpi CBS 119687 TaxID=1392245 RepID=A0A6A6AEI7_9PLEO|nr:uncharacterized protein P153DRAFT_366743 [Dothidotthia symphoricarpi CBS 119687]KAF2129337.1 hypothetical protein P153DRAFT_366743 [Dothidotthia symphoricarpi CBS 119687]